MNVPSIIGKERELFRFMKEHGYPVFHKSNMFLRDLQFGIRDYHRASSKVDIGSRNADKFAAELIDDLVRKGIFIPMDKNTWMLVMEEFLVPPKKEEPKTEAQPA
jgi:hypothetical protein